VVTNFRENGQHQVPEYLLVCEHREHGREVINWKNIFNDLGQNPKRLGLTAYLNQISHQKVHPLAISHEVVPPFYPKLQKLAHFCLFRIYLA
jgi:hypothetical protein